ncbi:MAG: alpha/beta hydrolase [Alphaproteobacteria bacterium]|nr:alpha/beta hydrolase [Alphaproteobacteria bacterium]MCB9791499.1 alpha/beta hydrolase [Alphaproteobacteria bacterium]
MFKLLLALLTLTLAAPTSSYGPMLEGFDYPFPVQRLALRSQAQDLSMAYLDVKPERPNGETIVLLHGKNFCAATWEQSIRALSAQGYRVVAPDQIGFCKSSKPERYQFSLAQLAANTHALLEHLGVPRARVMGHSMGGMLAIRYALQYPEATTQLLLVNPIGLEDWRAAGVPWRSVDEWYAGALKTTHDSIRAYQQKAYFAGDWKPEYDRWVDMLGGMYAGPGKEQVAWTQALASDMIFNQPVVYELPQLQVPTVLFIGQRDRTAIGRDRATPALAEALGDYPALGRAAAEAIPDATLVPFEGLGHSPHVEAPERFHAALTQALGALPAP